MRRTVFLVLCVLVIFISGSSAQKRINVKKILDQFGYTAKTYLLSANRPSYGINSYITPEKKVSLDFGTAFNDDFAEVPLSLSYGLSNSVELQTGIVLYTQSYNFAGEKIRGIGDANIGIKFRFQESENFEHAFQFILKLPTADKQTQQGTGKVDFHLGVVQAFYYKNFSYDFSAELNFLKRRDFPDLLYLPRLPKPALDSIMKIYDYDYERELIVSFSPAYYFGERTALYGGMSFSRNFRLDYNSLELYGGLGYSFSDWISASTGVSFGLINEKGWLISAGISLLL